MTEIPAGDQWAPIRFHHRERLEVPPKVAETARWVALMQADDDTRFEEAVEGLTSRLDVSGGAVIVMTFDNRFALLFENWVASCDRSGIDVRQRSLVFPTDRAAFERAESLGFIAYFDERSTLLQEMTESGKYGDRSWTSYMYHQNWVIQRVLQLDLEILFQDVDVIWRHDPLPVLAAQGADGADIQAMYDGPNPRFQPLYANSGFLYFANTDRVREFWAEMYERHDMVGYYRSQQEPLNVLLAAHAHRGMRVVLLDQDQFANGHRFCGGRTRPEDPWVVHHSWTKNLAGKLDRYVANGHWYLSDDALRSFGPPRQSERSPARLAAAHPGADEPDASGGRLAQTPLELLDRIRRDRDALANRVEAMLGSTSWRMTAPLRIAKDWVIRRRRRALIAGSRTPRSRRNSGDR